MKSFTVYQRIYFSRIENRSSRKEKEVLETISGEKSFRNTNNIKPEDFEYHDKRG